MLSVCESVGDLSLSLPVSHSLSPTALANNEMYSNSPTQSIGLFVLHVCYSRSPFLLLILIQLFAQIAAKLLLCLSIFLILSQPAASTHKIQKKEAKKNAEKQTLYRKLFLFWTLTQSYDDFVLLPHLRE